MKPIAPGTVVFHRFRGYAVLTAVNLLTGWVSARFGNERKTIDLNLSTDELTHADGEPIRFRLNAPEFMPHARLMEMIELLHEKGYEKLYLHTSPNASGMHWYWHLMTNRDSWVPLTWRKGWYGCGSSYIFNPVMGWNDVPGATAEELAQALIQFDSEGLQRARGKDKQHTDWFSHVCHVLLPNYMYSLERKVNSDGNVSKVLPIYPVRQGVRAYDGPSLPFPPGWRHFT